MVYHTNLPHLQRWKGASLCGAVRVHREWSGFPIQDAARLTGLTNMPQSINFVICVMISIQTFHPAVRAATSSSSGGSGSSARQPRDSMKSPPTSPSFGPAVLPFAPLQPVYELDIKDDGFLSTEESDRPALPQLRYSGAVNGASYSTCVPPRTW